MTAGGSQGVRDPQKVKGREGGAGELYYLRLVEGREGVDASASSSKWTMRFYDVPEPGKKQVTARMMTSVEVADGDPVGFVEGLGYR